MRVANGAKSLITSTSRRTTKLAVKDPRGVSHIEALEGRILFSTNLLVNGNFSQGATGFTSEYVHKPYAGGGYVVGHNPKVDLGADGDKYFTMGDHTTGTGLMLEADASTKANTVVWEETVPVVKTENYVFKGYDASIADANKNGIDPSPARLAVYIDGVWTGDVFPASAKDGQWSLFSTAWVDQAGTTANIKIVDMNTAISGNDFVLDDLSFKHSPNLIANGDFSEGNAGFTSQYTYKDKTDEPGIYAVGANPSKNLNSDFASIGDHTTSTGFMLEADGSTTANRAVWEERLDVTKGDDYIFSGWAASISQLGGNHTDPSPARLAIYVNGVKLGNTFSVAAKDGQWAKFSSIWDATVSGAVTIKIVDLNTNEHGNDFVLDDLAFEQI